MVALIACIAVPIRLLAAGGCYIDNINVSNSQETLLADNFDEGDMQDWDINADVNFIDMTNRPPNGCLFFNRCIESRAQAGRVIDAPKVGPLNVSALFWLPQVKEQWGWSHKTVNGAYLYIFSGNSNDAFHFGVSLTPGEKGYRIILAPHKTTKLSDGREVTRLDKERKTSTPVLSAGRWATISLQLDPVKADARVYLDGKELLACPYEPVKFQSLKRVEIVSGLGSLQPEKL